MQMQNQPWKVAFLLESCWARGARERYGMASWWPVKFRSNAVFQGLIQCVFCLKCMIVYHADAKPTLKNSIFDWKLLGQRGPGALSYRVLNGNIGVVSEFENRQSRQFCMKTKINVEKARREAMHMSWKVHDIERFSSLKWAITNLIKFVCM